MRTRTSHPQSGVALIVVMVALAFMTVMIMEIAVTTRVDANISANARNRLQAHYLARSGAKLQLLRLHMFQYVRNLKDQNGSVPLEASMIDRIWNTPMPEFPLSVALEQARLADASQNNDSRREETSDETSSSQAAGSLPTPWPGSFTAMIQSEGSKIPINLLDADKHQHSSEEARDEVKRQLTKLIEGLLEDEEFDRLYRGLEPDDLINPLIDWIDADQEKVEGGDENRDYEGIDPAYKPRNGRIPTITELHMVRGWTDDLYNRIAPDLSALNVNVEVNPNYLSPRRLKTWGPDLSDEEIALIIQKRSVTPFASLKALQDFVQNDPDIRGGDTFEIPKEILDKSSDRETVFRIESTGIVGQTRKNLRLGVFILSEKETKKMEEGQQVTKPGKLVEPQVVFVEEFL